MTTFCYRGYSISEAVNTNVIYKTGQCLRNHTVVNADGYMCLVQSGGAKIGLLHLSNRYKSDMSNEKTENEERYMHKALTVPRHLLPDAG